MTSRVTSEAGIQFLIREEGSKSLAYPDPCSPLYRWCLRNHVDPYDLVDIPSSAAGLSGEPWTIGVGHTSGVHQGMVWSEKAIEAALKADLMKSEAAINGCVTVPLTQNQFDALVSFCHNLGIYALMGSTLLRLLNAGNYEGAADQFGRWDMVAGEHNSVIHARRLREAALFLTPDQETL